MDFSKMSTEELRALVAGKPQQAPQQAAPAAPQAPQGSSWGADAADFARGVGHGALAPVRGISQIYSRAMGNTEDLNRKLKEEEAAEKKLGTWGQVGNVGAQIGTTFIPFAGQAGKAAQVAAKGANVLGKTGTAAAKGAALGAINPVAGGSADSYDEAKLWQAGLGAGLAGGASKVADKLFTPSTSAAVQQASKDFGGKATPGQLIAARGTPFSQQIGELEEQAGRWLSGSGIEKSRAAGRSEATKNLVRDVGEQAGLKRSTHTDFGDVLDSTQAAKKAAYDKVAGGMSVGNTQAFQKGVHDFYKTAPAMQKLNNQEAETVRNIMSGLFPASSQTGSLVSASGKPISAPGGFTGQDVQRALSDLSKEIKNSFGAASSGSDKRVGEALKAMRGHIEDSVKKHSSPGTWDELQKLNKAHTQLGKIQGAANYKKAIEGGEPRLGDIVQRAAAGAGDRPLNAARQQLVDRAVQLENIGGKGYQPSDLRDIQRLVSAASHIPSYSLQALYNPQVIGYLNKLAQQGDPRALKMLEKAGIIGAVGAGESQ